MILSEEELPQDVPSLQELVLDLARRLQNAQHTIDAERRATIQAQRQAEYFRNRLSESVRSFRLESARIRNTDFKTSMHIESKKYEDNKNKGNTIHEELRLLELDHTMTGNRHFVPVKLQRLRAQAKQLEIYQESQKHTLQQFNDQVQQQESLTTAIQQNDLQLTITLLRQGVDANYVDNAGYLPLHYACVYGMYDIAELLLEWGSDYTSYLSGHAPIVLAAQNGHVNIIRLLLDYGASIEESGKSSTPPLIAALLAGNFSTVEFLLQNGCLVNTVDKSENTALHLATRLPLDSARHLIMLLLEYGADPTKLNRAEQTPEAMGLYEHHREAALFLREAVSRREAEIFQKQMMSGQGSLGEDSLQMDDFRQQLPGIVSNVPHNMLEPFEGMQKLDSKANSAHMLLQGSGSLASVASSVSSPSILSNSSKQKLGHSQSNTAVANRKPLSIQGPRSKLGNTNIPAENSKKKEKLVISTVLSQNIVNEQGSINDGSAGPPPLNGLDQPSIASSVTYNS